MNELLRPDPSDALWQQVRPVLDDVMHELNDEDRTAVVLRFFEGQSLKQVGLALDEGLQPNSPATLILL
jgi:DNA-directed RNA polymerase specialized sigma24 family protein